MRTERGITINLASERAGEPKGRIWIALVIVIFAVLFILGFFWWRMGSLSKIGEVGIFGQKKIETQEGITTGGILTEDELESTEKTAIDSQYLRGATIGTGEGDIPILIEDGKIDIRMLPLELVDGRIVRLNANGKIDANLIPSDMVGVGLSESETNQIEDLVVGMIDDAIENDSMLHNQNTDTGTDSNKFNIGNDSGLSHNFSITVSNDDDKPALRYNGDDEVWEYSNDGSQFMAFADDPISDFVLSGDSGADQIISDANTLEIAGGTNIATVVGATDTVTINLDSTLSGVTWNGSVVGVAYGGSGTSTAFTQGSVVFAGSGGVYSQDNANFFWDDTNNRLGIGTVSPSQALDLIGDIELENTTFSNQSGIVYKSTAPFIHNFNYGNNGTVITEGANVFVGENAGNFTMGSTAIGAYEASYNTVMGYNSFLSNTLGWSNVSVGFETLYSNTEGYLNSAFGERALYSNNTGTNNTGIGSNSMYSNTTGSLNVAVGYAALYDNTIGGSNAAFGSSSMRLNTSGDFNVASGRYSLYANTTGSNNIGLGYRAGFHQADGVTNLADPENSIYIGTDSRGFSNADSNSIVIGYNAIGIGANTVVLGNDSIVTTALKGNVGIRTTTFGTGAVGAFAIANGTAPSTSIADGVQLYAEDVTASSELKVRDEAGNITTLSPHNFSLIGNPSEDLAWSFYSERDGKSINVDMTKSIRLIEELTGEKLIYLKDNSTGDMYDDNVEYDKLYVIDEIENLKNKVNNKINNQLSMLNEIQDQIQEMGDIKQQNRILMDFMLTINGNRFVEKDENGNVFLDGKIDAESMEGGSIVIKVINGKAPTIGEAEICSIVPIDENNDNLDDCSGNAIPADADSDGRDDVSGKDMPVDENKDWLDDENGEPIVNDGKHVFIETEAAGENSKIFVTPKTIMEEPLSVTKIEPKKGFLVEVKNTISSSVQFNWWVVEMRLN